MKISKSNASFYFILFLLIAFQQTQSQIIEPTNNNSQSELYDIYTLQQKRNNTAAWIFLGSGLAVTVIGFEIGNHGDLDDIGTAAVLVVAGGAATLASVPLFIVAAKNKRKASLSLKGESITFGNLSYKKSKQISLALTIDL